jgi:Protein of unknown function (DUF3298)/Deacetylase PdaC
MKFLLTLFFSGSLVLAQDLTPDRFYYLGTVGTEQCQLELSLNNQQLSGISVRAGQTWFLEGHWAYEGPARLTERNQAGEQGGLWLAKISTSSQDYAGTLTGMYDDGQAVPFSLHKVAEYVSSQLIQGRIQSTVSYPFFIDPIIFNEAVQTVALEEQRAFFVEGQDLETKGEVFNGWTLETKYQIHYASKNVLSLLGTRFLYSGGAHPSTDYVVINLRTNGDELLEIGVDDLFKDDALPVLIQYVSDELKKQDAAWIVDASVILSKTDLRLFTFSALGMTFYFPPYLVGPYAQGTFEVELPMETVQQLGLESMLPSFIQ